MKRAAAATVLAASLASVFGAGLPAKASSSSSASSSGGGEVARFPLVPPVRVRLEGRSNLGGWSCRGTQAGGAITFAASRDDVLAAAERLSQDAETTAASDGYPAVSFELPPPEFEMRIPVESLSCGNRRMERDLRRAVRAEVHPDIVFLFLDLRPAVERAEGALATFRVLGRVSLAGHEREIEVEVLADRLGVGRYRVRTELPLRMTWFGIQLPVGLFGLIRSEDSLLVGLDVVVALATEPETR